jgi:hypothetical protein
MVINTDQVSFELQHPCAVRCLGGGMLSGVGLYDQRLVDGVCNDL